MNFSALAGLAPAERSTVWMVGAPSLVIAAAAFFFGDPVFGEFNSVIVAAVCGLPALGIFAARLLALGKARWPLPVSYTVLVAYNLAAASMEARLLLRSPAYSDAATYMSVVYVICCAYLAATAFVALLRGNAGSRPGN